MKKWFVGVVLVLLAAGVGEAQTLSARPGDWLVWDQIQTDTVTRFEMKVDAGAFTSIGLPPVTNDAQTQAGHNSYAWQIPVNSTLTTHTYAVRACNTACGPELTGSVTLSPATPTSPTNGFRIRPGAQGLVVLPPGAEE